MWRARRGGLKTASRTTNTNLDCAFVENALLFVALKIGRPPLSAPLGREATLVPIRGYDQVCQG